MFVNRHDVRGGLTIKVSDSHWQRTRDCNNSIVSAVQVETEALGGCSLHLRVGLSRCAAGCSGDGSHQRSRFAGKLPALTGILPGYDHQLSVYHSIRTPRRA